MAEILKARTFLDCLGGRKVSSASLSRMSRLVYATEKDTLKKNWKLVASRGEIAASTILSCAHADSVEAAQHPGYDRRRSLGRRFHRPYHRAEL